jgi:cytochrome b561
MTPTYDSRTVFLHWLSAVLVLGLWIVGQCIDFFPKGTPRVTVRSLHIALGVLLLATVVVRVLWRRTGGVKLPPADSGAAGKLAIGVHHLLYALLIALVALGLASVWFRGDNIFNLFTVPAFDPGNKALAHNTVELHGLLANVLLLVAGLHGAAAAWHHWGLKDGVLARMWPGLALRSGQPRN